MLKKKKLNFKQWMEHRGKIGYVRGGDMASPVSANTNATSEYVEPERVVDDSASSQQRTAGSVISGIGGIASAINPLIGAAIGAIGGIVSSSAQPAVSYKTRQNTNPYGYKHGGNLLGDPIKPYTSRSKRSEVPPTISINRESVWGQDNLDKELWVERLKEENRDKTLDGIDPSDKDAIARRLQEKAAFQKELAAQFAKRDVLQGYANGGNMFAGLTKAFTNIAGDNSGGETEGDIPVDGKLDVTGFLNLRDKQKLMNFSNDTSTKSQLPGDIYGWEGTNATTTPTTQMSGQAIEPDQPRGPGMKYGGNIRRYANGGDLQALSEDSIQVKADNPSMTDSVETDKAMLDHNEVVTGSKVFSDSLVNPNTGNSFATDEARNQKLLGKFQKKQAKLGDTEYKDEGYLKKNSEALFESQEQLAQMIGLRNEDGTPVQDSGMRFGGMLGKNKPRYANGGGYPDPDRKYLATMDLRTLVPNSIGGADYSSPILPTSDINPIPQNSAMAMLQSNIAIDDYTNNQRLLKSGLQSGPGIPFNIQSKSNPFQLAGANVGFDPNQDYTDSAPVSGPPNPNTFNQDGTGVDKKEFPFGEVGTGVGLVSNIVNKLTNRPTFVNYKDLGRAEINLQDKAMQNIRQGESAAIGDVTMEGKVARENLSNRSLQSRNANLRNIATGISKAKAGIRAQFASTLASAQMQSGQRRSAIEESNRQKDMNVDVINTQEADAVRTEAMKMDENVRKLLIEYQLGNNNKKTNDILATLLQTGDYEYDINAPEGGIKFKKKTKIR